MQVIFPIARGGFAGELFRWFFRVLIYDIVVTSIAEILGVSRIVALFIFLGGMIIVGIIGYVLKQRMSPGIDD